MEVEEEDNEDEKEEEEEEDDEDKEVVEEEEQDVPSIPTSYSQQTVLLLVTEFAQNMHTTCFKGP